MQSTPSKVHFRRFTHERILQPIVTIPQDLLVHNERRTGWLFSGGFSPLISYLSHRGPAAEFAGLKTTAGTPHHPWRL